jgi:hypothetical protein
VAQSKAGSNGGLPVPEVVTPAAWAIVAGGVDVEGRYGFRPAGTCSSAHVGAGPDATARSIPPALPPAARAGGSSEVSPPDWSI